MNEQLKSQPHSGHESDRIENGVITTGSYITADSPFFNKWAQSRLVLSITIKQLTMTLKAVLASAERAFGVRSRDRAHGSDGSSV